MKPLCLARMFGADRFGPEQDYSATYHQLGGTLKSHRVNELIQSAFDYLQVRYPDPAYQEAFPPVQEALIAIAGDVALSQQDLNLLVETFAHHELGAVPAEYSAAIVQLSKQFRLGLVVDIWAPKALGGATAAGIACTLVGGAAHPAALGAVSSLLELAQIV